MEKDAKIYIAGHTGLVGSAILRRLNEEGYNNIITKSSAELDLRVQKDVESFFVESSPDYVFLAAATVGGIFSNNAYPADFIYNNLMIQSNVIHSSYKTNIKKLLFLGSTCIYPKLSKQPLKEEYLLTGPLEKTNEWYAIAKIAGIKLCQAYHHQYGCDFISVMPTNLYGPGDNFDLQTSHVLPALIRKFHEAKINNESSVVVWGTGTPRREFCYIDDCVDACLFLMDQYSSEDIINIGVGEDVTIHDLAIIIKEVVDYNGDIEFDEEMPDGTPRKLVDTSKINKYGWTAKTKLNDGIRRTYKWYLDSGLA